MVKKKLTDKQKKERAARNAKKMTVGKALDMLSLGHSAIHKGIQSMTTGDIGFVKYGIVRNYSGFDMSNNTLNAESLINGYGPALNRTIEKKLFKVLGIRGPRTKLETIGDGIDYSTYFGATAFHIYNNRDNPVEASRQAGITQFGVDQSMHGYAAYQPLRMITDKLGPYVAQKLIRKGLRTAGIKMPKMTGG